jgi:hypothetical protein
MPGMTALGLNPIAQDQRTIAERKWRAPTKARVEQQACDVGLFSDDAMQSDLLNLPGVRK